MDVQNDIENKTAIHDGQQPKPEQDSKEILEMILNSKSFNEESQKLLTKYLRQYPL